MDMPINDALGQVPDANRHVAPINSLEGGPERDLLLRLRQVMGKRDDLRDQFSVAYTNVRAMEQQNNLPRAFVTTPARQPSDKSADGLRDLQLVKLEAGRLRVTMNVL